jgi:hypothetical protein
MLAAATPPGEGEALMPTLLLIEDEENERVTLEIGRAAGRDRG